MTALETRLYTALLGARTIVAATANVNPAAMRILRLVDSAAAGYTVARGREIVQDDTEESLDAHGN